MKSRTHAIFFSLLSFFFLGGGGGVVKFKTARKKIV